MNQCQGSLSLLASAEMTHKRLSIVPEKGRSNDAFADFTAPIFIVHDTDQFHGQKKSRRVEKQQTCARTRSNDHYQYLCQRKTGIPSFCIRQQTSNASNGQSGHLPEGDGHHIVKDQWRFCLFALPCLPTIPHVHLLYNDDL